MNYSKEYLDQLTNLHVIKSFGNSTKIHKQVQSLVDNNNIKSILDYGSGKGGTSEAFKNKWPTVNVISYDPVTSPIELPNNVDLIYSADVLEHIEPDYFDETMDYLFKSSKHQWHLIACHPAKKSLSDGRNAHLIIEQPEWWLKEFQKRLGTEWKIVHSEDYIKVGKTKKAGVLHSLKFIIELKRK
jgi:hypothetical protein